MKIKKPNHFRKQTPYLAKLDRVLDPRRKTRSLFSRLFGWGVNSYYSHRVKLNIVSLIGIFIFFVLSPVVGKPPGFSKPIVKASFVSEPILPTGKDLPVPALTAQGVFVMDLDSGLILYDKNPHLRLKPASLTKIMTSIIALDHYQEDEILRVKNGHNSIGNTAKLIKGDQLNASDLIYALLVPSGNDAAVTLAENYPGGYSAFLEKMNQKAIELGLENTHFVNVSGIESPNHYTSAYDIAIIARSALERLQFSNIVSTRNITINSLKGFQYPLATTNVLLGRPDVLGVKTGWTPEAGECLVILAEQQGHKVLISILGSEDRFGEGRRLIDWVYQNYSWL